MKHHAWSTFALLVVAISGCGSEAASRGSVSDTGASTNAPAGPGPSATSSQPGASAASGDAGTSTPLPALPACSSSESGAGTYAVPVPVELAPYASYPVDYVVFCAQGTTARLSYDLPAMLLGSAVHVQFEGPFDTTAATLVLSGTSGNATCRFNAGTWSCREQLSGITIDTRKLGDQLAGLPAAEAQGRQQVSATFGQDPIGILEVALSATSSGKGGNDSSND